YPHGTLCPLAFEPPNDSENSTDPPPSRPRTRVPEASQRFAQSPRPHPPLRPPSTRPAVLTFLGVFSWRFRDPRSRRLVRSSDNFSDKGRRRYSRSYFLHSVRSSPEPYASSPARRQRLTVFRRHSG